MEGYTIFLVQGELPVMNALHSSLSNDDENWIKVYPGMKGEVVKKNNNSDLAAAIAASLQSINQQFQQPGQQPQFGQPFGEPRFAIAQSTFQPIAQR